MTVGGVRMMKCTQAVQVFLLWGHKSTPVKQTYALHPHLPQPASQASFHVHFSIPFGLIERDTLVCGEGTQGSGNPITTTVQKLWYSLYTIIPLQFRG
jgi:hypothetical protein